MLPCPRCNVTLETHAARGSVHYICPKCDGRVGNLALLRRTLEPDTVNRLWRQVCDAHPTDHHGLLRCPSCRTRMHPAGVPCASGEEVQLDACRVCQIVWLDAGEIERLPRQPPPEPPVSGRLKPEAVEAIAPVLMEHQRNRGERIFGEGSPMPRNMPDHPLAALLTLLGFPVKENAPVVRSKPWITWATAALCILVTLGAMMAGVLDEVIQRHGFVPAYPFRGDGFTAVTSFFIHAGILHLVFNMWFLILAGDNCEDLLGAWRYLVLLAGGALIALLSHALLDPRPEIPVVGASGGISALLAFYAIVLPRVRLVICLRLGWYPLWLRMSVGTAMCLWVAGQIVGAILQMYGQGSVSCLAHLGGALAGLVTGLLYKRGPQGSPAAL